MSTAAGIVIATGGITLMAEVLEAQYPSKANPNGYGDILSSINWRVIPATVVAAIAINGLAAVNDKAATMLASIGLVTVLLTRRTSYGGNSPGELLFNYMGYPTT